MAELLWRGWVNPHLWPEEPEGFIFLGRAFDLVGKAMWLDWTGHEVRDSERDVGRRLPSTEAAYVDGEPQWGIHREYGPDVIKAAGKGHPNPSFPIPADLWRIVAEHNHQEFDHVLTSIARRDAVVSECHQLALSGDLQFAWRRKWGGMKPEPVTPHEWEIDYPWVPFATLGYGTDIGLSSPEPTGWLFVTASSLEKVLGCTPAGSEIDGSSLLTNPSDIIALKTPLSLTPVKSGLGYLAEWLRNVDPTEGGPQFQPTSHTDNAAPQRDDMIQRIASELDAASIPIREVKRAHILKLWNVADGPVPKVDSVTFYMVGAGKGGRRRGT